MTKIKVWCDSGANIESCRQQIIDTVEDWSLDEGEWEEMDEEEQEEMVNDWAYERLEIGYETLEEKQ